MSNDTSDNLLEWLLDLPNNIPLPVPHSPANTPVAVGQIRRLEAVEGQPHPSRRVLVIDVVENESVAIVALVVPQGYCTTNRDVFFASTSPGDYLSSLVFVPDATASVWCEQLESSPVYTMVDCMVVEAVREAPFISAENLASHVAYAGLRTGLLSCYPDDYVWLRRGREASALGDLAFDCAWRNV